MRTDPTATDPVSGKSLTSQAFERLRADILGGQLQPLQRLRIQALSEHYGIGATAIREALSRLVTDGFVESEDQRGFHVAPVAQEDLMDLTRTRVELESIALRSAIEHGGIDWEAAMLASYHRLARTPPPTSPGMLPAWADAHQRFHEALVAGCPSRWLLRMCRILFDQSERYRNLADRYTSKQDRDPGIEHRLLMEATMARDSEKATKLLAEHFWTTTRIILRGAFGVEDAPVASPRRARKARS